MSDASTPTVNAYVVVVDIPFVLLDSVRRLTSIMEKVVEICSQAGLTMTKEDAFKEILPLLRRLCSPHPDMLRRLCAPHPDAPIVFSNHFQLIGADVYDNVFGPIGKHIWRLFMLADDLAQQINCRVIALGGRIDWDATRSQRHPAGSLRFAVDA